MKLLELTQNTPEWHTWRRSHIGASECASVMGKDPYRTPYGLWLGKMHGEENYTNFDIERGRTMEEEARQYISSALKKDFRPICAESEENPWQIASLDCYHDRETVLSGEIKCPRLKKINEIREQGIPEYWMWQLQHQMAVTGHKKMFFLAFSREDRFFKWVERFEPMIENLIKAESIFYHDYMSKFTPPPFMPGECN